MIGKNGGRRVYEVGRQNGRSPNPFFAGLEDYFKRLKQTRADIKYELSREIPGLEIVFASDDLKAATVWKEGADLRVAAAEKSVREKLTNEINSMERASQETDDEDITDEIDKKMSDLIDKRRYEGYAWYKVANGEAAGITSQPAGVDCIPPNDGLTPSARQESWKARAGDTEIRASEKGLFKVQRGKMTKIRDGIYDSPVITPNGRWLVVQKGEEEGPAKLVRIDLIINKEYDLADEIDGAPKAFLPTLNRVLLVENYNDPRPDDLDTALDEPPHGDVYPEGMTLVDPATGKAQPVAGEFRPLSEQMFRPLQKTGRPNEFWAALPNTIKNETEVGIYDTNHFGFRTILRIPKIKFNSMKMWVDEPGGKIYFVYRGQALSLPLPK
jgi:hypothetical protein